jgi:Ca2+-binding RTX toxin-like protein
MGMRKTLLLMVTMLVALLVGSGVAWALNKVGTNGPDTLKGTKKGDNLIGRGGNDVLFGG